MTRTRDAHFPTGNRETGNWVPGNFPREMGDREIGKKSGKSTIFLPENDPKSIKMGTKNTFNFGINLFI